MTTIEKIDWFEEEKRGDNLLCYPSLEAMETTLDLLLEARIKQLGKHTWLWSFD